VLCFLINVREVLGQFSSMPYQFFNKYKLSDNYPVGQWASGPVGQWASGPVGQWANGPVGQWANGPVGQWASGPAGQQASGPAGLTHKHWTRLERLARDKYSSSLRKSVNYSCKTFFCTGPW
jgi:hypothetical protein